VSCLVLGRPPSSAFVVNCPAGAPVALLARRIAAVLGIPEAARLFPLAADAAPMLLFRVSAAAPPAPSPTSPSTAQPPPPLGIALVDAVLDDSNPHLLKSLDKARTSYVAASYSTSLLVDAICTYLGGPPRAVFVDDACARETVGQVFVRSQDAATNSDDRVDLVVFLPPQPTFVGQEVDAGLVYAGPPAYSDLKSSAPSGSLFGLPTAGGITSATVSSTYSSSDPQQHSSTVLGSGGTLFSNDSSADVATATAPYAAPPPPLELATPRVQVFGLANSTTPAPSGASENVAFLGNTTKTGGALEAGGGGRGRGLRRVPLYVWIIVGVVVVCAAIGIAVGVVLSKKNHDSGCVYYNVDSFTSNTNALGLLSGFGNAVSLSYATNDLTFTPNATSNDSYRTFFYENVRNVSWYEGTSIVSQCDAPLTPRARYFVFVLSGSGTARFNVQTTCSKTAFSTGDFTVPSAATTFAVDVTAITGNASAYADISAVAWHTLAPAAAGDVWTLSSFIGVSDLGACTISDYTLLSTAA
ncbi:hypothetical protein HK405_014128, partial [Cladochytrium tenue]